MWKLLVEFDCRRVDYHYSLCEYEEEIKLLTQEIRLSLASFYRANWWNLKGEGERGRRWSWDAVRAKCPLNSI